MATNVNGTVITSSPGPTPAASSDRCSALVPLLTPIASDVWQNAAKCFSKATTAGPRMNCALSNDVLNARSISGLSAPVLRPEINERNHADVAIRLRLAGKREHLPMRPVSRH